KKVHPELNPVDHDTGEINLYGVKKGKNFKEILDYEVPEYEY
ncbi:unnamed protein product, partial [Scytosiphon promiscuus]